MYIFERLAIIGLGLIGSSIARAAKKAGVVREIVAIDRDENIIKRVVDLNIADKCFTDAARGVEGADLVILAVPVLANAAIAKEIAPHLKNGAILSDVGSVKSAVIRDVAHFLPSNVHFIPAHPIAGTEHSGPDAGFAELFDNRWVILTPPDGTDEEKIEKMRQFWQAFGANIEIMSADHHDLVLAITSHVPHLIAYTIVGTASDLENVTRSEVIKFSASGFRDFTRIAASDPTMWRDIFLSNKQAVLEMLGRLTEDLSVLQKAIRCGDGDTLHAFFTKTRAIRRNIIEQGQDVDAPDFGRRVKKKSE